MAVAVQNGSFCFQFHHLPPLTLILGRERERDMETKFPLSPPPCHHHTCSPITTAATSEQKTIPGEGGRGTFPVRLFLYPVRTFPNISTCIQLLLRLETGNNPLEGIRRSAPLRLRALMCVKEITDYVVFGVWTLPNSKSKKRETTWHLNRTMYSSSVDAI